MDYDLARELVYGLEAVKKTRLDDVVKDKIAAVVAKRGIHDIFALNQLIDAMNYPPSGEDFAEDSTVEELKPGIELASKFLAKQIKTRVEDIRELYFKSRSAPFPNLEKAKASILDLTGIREEENPDKVVEHQQHVLGLLRNAKRLDDATGFDGVLYYILADIQPILRNVKEYPWSHQTRLPTSWTSWEKPRITVVDRYVAIEIRSELTHKELQDLYRRIRQHLGMVRSKAFTQKHLEIYEMVEQRGGPPEVKGTVAFWKSINDEWNRKHKNDKYTTWKGVKIAYDRLHKKLSRRYLMEDD